MTSLFFSSYLSSKVSAQQPFNMWIRLCYSSWLPIIWTKSSDFAVSYKALWGPPLATSLTSPPATTFHNLFQPHVPPVCSLHNNAHSNSGTFPLLFLLPGISLHRYLHGFAFISFRSVFSCHHHTQIFPDCCLTACLVNPCSVHFSRLMCID